VFTLDIERKEKEKEHFCKSLLVKLCVPLTALRIIHYVISIRCDFMLSLNRILTFHFHVTNLAANRTDTSGNRVPIITIQLAS